MKILKTIILSIVAWVLVLLSLAFIEGNANVFQWPKGLRFIAVALTFCGLIPIMMFHFDKK